VVGDSLAYSLGLGLMDNEQHYGVEVANAGMLGCAFTTTGELDAGGEWQPQAAGCPTALEEWSRNANELGARAVVVDVGISRPVRLEDQRQGRPSRRARIRRSGPERD